MATALIVLGSLQHRAEIESSRKTLSVDVCISSDIENSADEIFHNRSWAAELNPPNGTSTPLFHSKQQKLERCSCRSPRTDLVVVPPRRPRHRSQLSDLSTDPGRAGIKRTTSVYFVEPSVADGTSQGELAEVSHVLVLFVEEDLGSAIL